MAEKPTDSVAHHKERADKIRAEAKHNQEQDVAKETKRQTDQAWKDLAARQAEDAELTKYTGLVHDDETREQLLERIRKLREEKPGEPSGPPPQRTEYQMQEFTAEQEAGRAAVAKVKAEQDRMRELQRKHDAEKRDQEASMTPVHHPNPSQQEMFPTVKATLK